MSVPAHLLLPCNSRCNLSPCLSPYFWRKKKTWRKGWLGWVWRMKLLLLPGCSNRPENSFVLQKVKWHYSKGVWCSYLTTVCPQDGLAHVRRCSGACIWQTTGQCFPRSRLCREHRQNAWEAGACAHPLAQRVFPQLTDCSVDDSNTVRGSHVSTWVFR